MNYYDALRVFSIDNVTDLSQDNLKKIYRKLAKKWHPDVCGSDEKYKEIQAAYEILRKNIKELGINNLAQNTLKKESIIVTLESLVNLFKNNQPIRFGKKEINKFNINNHEVYIGIDIRLNIDGIDTNSYFVKPRSNRDDYIINIEIPDTDLTREVDITLKMLDKTVNCTMNGIRKNVRFNFDYIAQVTVALQRIPYNSD